MCADHRRVLDAFRFVAWAERELDRGAGTSRLDAPVVGVRRSHSLVAFRHSSDERNPADVTLDRRKESWARSSASPASRSASSSATRSIVLEAGSCRSGAIEIRSGSGSATSEGACDEKTIA